jgi:hypothetical protein
MDFTLSDNDRIQLENMLRENEVEDTTRKIQELKHSSKLSASIKLIEKMKKQYPRMFKTDYEKFERMVRTRDEQWMWSHYTSIYHKLMKNQLDPSILNSMVDVLQKIENNEFTQHEASVAIGRMLKQIYIDGKIRDTPDTQRNKRKQQRKMKKIDWKEYKNRFLTK